MVIGIIAKGIGKLTKPKKKKTPFIRKGPKTIVGFKPRVGKERFPKVEDLTTTVDVPLPKDFDLPKKFRKPISELDRRRAITQKKINRERTRVMLDPEARKVADKFTELKGKGKSDAEIKKALEKFSKKFRRTK
jgi:hypothetical protein